MTSNQIKARDIKLSHAMKKEELKEKTRSNKAREEIDRSKAITDPLSKIGVGLLKLITNHKEWYLKDEVSAKNVANLSFNVPTGGRWSDLSQNTEGHVASVASVFIQYANMLPQTYLSGTASDGVNLAARSIYAYNRSHNSGSINYEPADYMMYLLAVGDLINLYAYLIKLVRCMKGYESIHNRLDTPKYVIEGLGYDYDDMVTHEKDLYSLINTLVKSVAPYAIPGGMPYYERKLWLVSNVFKQHDNDYSVFIHLHPYGFWKWQSRGLLDVAKLPRQGDKWTFSQLRTYVLNMISAVSINEDFSTMSGDTVKAYGDNVIRLTTVDCNSIPGLQPVYDKDALDQISSGNFVYMGTNPLLKVCQVTDPDSPKYGVIYQGSEVNPEEGVRINTVGQTFEPTFVSIQDSNNPDYVDVLRCTRFNCKTRSDSEYEGGSKLTTKIVSCGTEVLCGLSYIGYSVNSSGGGDFGTFSMPIYLVNTDIDTTKLTDYFQFTRFVESLPTIPVWENGNTPGLWYLINGPRGRYSLVTQETLDNINVVVFDSLLNIKQFYEFKNKYSK